MMTRRSSSISPTKVIIFFAFILIPTILIIIGAGSFLMVSDRAAEHIGLIYSVLAASLFATISIVGDPGNLLRGGWRTAWEQAKQIQLRLMRLVYLFVLYLIVLFLLVVSALVKTNFPNSFLWVHSAFAWVAIFAFLCSLWLPFEIKEIQMNRLENEIENRRKNN